EELLVETNKPILVNGVAIYYFRRQTGDHTHVSFPLWRKLWATAKEFNVIHLQSWWSLLIIGAAAICRAKKCRYIISPRGMLSPYSFERQHSAFKKLIHLAIGKRLLQKSILHATTKLEWEDCRQVYPAWKGFILPNIVRFPEQEIRKLTVGHKSEKPLVFGFLSRIDQKKGLELLLEALAKVDFDYRLRIGGKGDEGYLSELKKQCTELGIDGKVEWSGWFSGEEKFTFLSSVDVLTLTSYNENFANVVLESLLVGTPVLLSNQVGMAEFVDQYGLGWVCGLAIASIVERLNYINQHRESIAAIGQRSPDVIKKNFNRVHLGYHYSESYEQYSEAHSKQKTV
ncbi:MAG: glycosyltransferase, partial [Chitinophagaceae bacterium]